MERLPALERTFGGIHSQQSARLQEIVEFIQSQVSFTLWMDKCLPFGTFSIFTCQHPFCIICASTLLLKYKDLDETLNGKDQMRKHNIQLNRLFNGLDVLVGGATASFNLKVVYSNFSHDIKP